LNDISIKHACHNIESDASIYPFALFQDSLGENNKVEKILRFHYMICMLLPVLKRINQDQSVELEAEAITKGGGDDSPLIVGLCIPLLVYNGQVFDVPLCNREETI
jgi:hypothetical protein